MASKFREGEIVYAKMLPGKKMIISRYVDKLYYCKTAENLKLKELVYFERDLRAENSL